MRILHVFRSPVGGLFRHVRDLARGQAADGHEVGIVCDASEGGDAAAALLKDVATHCALGITRFPMSRLPALADRTLTAQIRRLASDIRADVLHGHGAKGGLYTRLAGAKSGKPSVYSPHGGSLHYAWRSAAGAAFLAAEKYLARKGSGFVFVCDFERRLFEAKIGLAGKPATVVHNGLWPEEFAPAIANLNAKDLLFVGEVRHLKGIDVLLDAVKLLQTERPLTLAVVGDGPELETYRKRSAELGLEKHVSFEGRKPIREAFKLGKAMVVPSRNESFPYVVLEAAAAGVPLLATAVGGIPEILPPSMLVERPDPALLANGIRSMFAATRETREAAQALTRRLFAENSAAAMACKITRFYETLGAPRD